MNYYIIRRNNDDRDNYFIFELLWAIICLIGSYNNIYLYSISIFHFILEYYISHNRIRNGSIIDNNNSILSSLIRGIVEGGSFTILLTDKLNIFNIVSISLLLILPYMAIYTNKLKIYSKRHINSHITMTFMTIINLIVLYFSSINNRYFSIYVKLSIYGLLWNFYTYLINFRSIIDEYNYSNILSNFYYMSYDGIFEIGGLYTFFIVLTDFIK